MSGSGAQVILGAAERKRSEYGRGKVLGKNKIEKKKKRKKSRHLFEE